MKAYPTISIVTCTYNPEPEMYTRVLQSIQNQIYPRKKIQHLIFDAGSTNNANKLAKKYGCDVSVRPDLVHFAQVRQSLAIKKARGDLVLILEADNILPTPLWLQEMVKPFLDDPGIFCTFSAYCGYDKSLTATTRYEAFFGTCDPAFYYLGKCDKIPMLDTVYTKGHMLAESSSYWKVKFDTNSLLTMGDNGFLVRRKILNKVNKNPYNYAHSDAFADLLTLGFDTYGVVKNSIIHVQPSSILVCAISRLKIKQYCYDGWRGKRKYLVFNWNSSKDKINIIKFIIYTVTLIVPIYKSLSGYIKIRDKAWFLHPIISYLMLITYSYSEILWFTRKYLKF